MVESWTTAGPVTKPWAFRSAKVDIDLGGVEQLVETSQTRAVANALDCLARSAMTRKLSMTELLDFLEAEMDAKGLDALMSGAFTAKYACPRRFEVAAAINRYREGKVEQTRP